MTKTKMKIKKVRINNHAKFIEVQTVKGQWRMPYARLRLKPTSENPIEEIFIDKELGSEAITYRVESGKEDSVHLDAFLDYNCDPDFMLQVELHRLTILARDLFEASSLTKKELERRLGTSRSQLNRLFDTANSRKSLDQMFRLLCVLEAEPHLEPANTA